MPRYELGTAPILDQASASGSSMCSHRALNTAISAEDERGMLWTASCSVSRSMVNCHVQCFQKLLFWLLILRDAPHSVGKDDFQLDFFLIDPGVPSDGKNQARCATKTFSQPHTPSPFLLKTSPPVQNTPKRAFSAKELELSEHPRLVASCLPVS